MRPPGFPGNFLCESYLRATHSKRTTAQDRTLQERTFYGKEKKSLAYVIAIMNMILHGIEAPNILHTNTLSENLADIQEKDRYDVILANPPFGGKERKSDGGRARTLRFHLGDWDDRGNRGGALSTRRRLTQTTNRARHGSGGRAAHEQENPRGLLCGRPSSWIRALSPR